MCFFYFLPNLAKYFIYFRQKFATMEKTTKINGKQNRVAAKPKSKRKSKYALWLEKHPNGIGKILDIEAVLQ